MRVTLLTDFGLRDGYVAAMKGAMLRRVPELRFVDISHEIPPGAIAPAAYVLRQAAPFFPQGTVHLVVVDPGVGGPRRGVACRIGEQLYVAPDNGVLGQVLALEAPIEAHEILSPLAGDPEPSPVFHGRDLFGPVAARLAAGGSFADVGPEVDPATLLRPGWPEPERECDGWTAVVIHVDRFGNLVTNLELPDGAPQGVAELCGHRLPLARTYSEVPEGALLALRGSTGLLEIARNGASAADLLGAAPGLVVAFRVHERS